MLLILRRHGDPMNRTLHIVSGQERESVAGVDGQRSVLRFSPFPFVSLVVADLERCDGLAEEQGEAAQV